ncbi:chemotaxis protein CheA [Geomonas silvestris]|uniref:Chemotaxis protein CheA n=1 Tax=Geomonas silvestris TaxID=2740184 RepID=A0A6V8MLD3_9BACT|nr:chemotaxis protein CheW [Geomonas silvestris]GFO60667.1 chemotaxis protein CheA [Geomonas silvestris]
MSNGKPGSDIDVKRFNQVFFEECAEHLAEMERILISLSDREPDQEQMNAIFRAAHSIKGGAGIFGFDDMTVVTHVMESLLDRLRKHEIGFTASMVDVLLEAGDVISMQLAGHREGSAVRQEAIDAVRGKLQRLVDNGPVSQPAAAAALPEPVPACEPVLSLCDDGALRRYELSFTPDDNIFRRGIRVESIIAELSELAEPGGFSSRAELVAVPRLEELDPESCLTRWHFNLTTQASSDQVMEVFMFVADEEQLSLRELPRETPAAAALPALPAAGPAPSAEPEPRLEGRRAYDRDETAPGAFGRRQGEMESSIRVNVTKVDQLINQVGELLITQAMLAQVAAELDPVRYETLHKGLAQLARNSRDLQGSVMSIRLVPISIVFSRFPRMVRELAARLGKSVDLKMVGETTELDKGLIEKVADPLSHLVRNALDHGLETSEARLASGKEATGTIQLKASQVAGRIAIEVSDDGAGLNRDKILAKASEAGVPYSESMSDEEVWQLIFAPGFSTADQVTDLSGRGVGMDVVLKNVQAMGGRVQIASQAGKGTCVTISLPLTLAILNGLSVAVGGEKFIIPLSAIIESLQPKSDQLKSVNGKQVVAVRGEYLPILRLHNLFNIETEVSDPRQGILVLVDLGGEKTALLVDALLDEQQVVVKSIETNYRRVEGSAGATILGDGRVALILDVAELFEMAKKAQPDPGPAKEAA